MAPIVDVQELTCSIPPTRFFKSFNLDSTTLLPKILPSVYINAQLVEGNGGVGSIKSFTFNEESEVKTMKHKIDEVDEKNHVYNFSIIEGASVGVDFESISCVNTIETGPDGGCILKCTTTYTPKGDNHNVIQEHIKKYRDALAGIFQAAVAHLHANPNEYS